MRPPSSERQLYRWAPALLFTLLLHLGVGWGLRYLDLFGATPPAAAEPPLVEVVFAPPTDEPPHRFTELPPDRAETPPERADLLSNVDSRARDQVPGGEDPIPRQEGISEFPEVRMDTGQPSPASAESKPSAESAPAAESEPAEPSPPNPESVAERRKDRERQTDPSEDPWAAFRRASTTPRTTPAPNSSPSAPSAGGFSDIRQEAMASLESNAEFPGDISLNTKEWDWAPWLLAFRRELMESWTAPLGYHLGLISGWTLLEVVIAPSGEVLSNRVLDEEGNVAFRESSLSAIERSKPYLPLPADFPEETLILNIRLGYPEWQPQPMPQRRPEGRR